MKIVTAFLHRLQLADGPDRVCRTRMISESFFECKVRKPNPNYCEHSMCSGDSFICNHHDRGLFAGK